MLVAVGDLPGAEHDIHQIPAQRPGKRFFQKRQIHFRLLLAHQPKGGVDPGDDLPVAVHIAAEDAADTAFIQAEAPADLIEFFLIHVGSFPVGVFYVGIVLYHLPRMAARGPLFAPFCADAGLLQTLRQNSEKSSILSGEAFSAV